MKTFEELELIAPVRRALADERYETPTPIQAMTIPPALEGRTVLDLGCGSGRDVYLLSKLVGSNGHVIGVDMTEEQLAVAEKHLAYHTDKV